MRGTFLFKVRDQDRAWWRTSNRSHWTGVPENGGADRDRTGDPLLAKQVLSQLSYSPDCEQGGGPG